MLLLLSVNVKTDRVNKCIVNSNKMNKIFSNVLKQLKAAKRRLVDG